MDDSNRGNKKSNKQFGGEDELKIHILVPKKTTLKNRLKCDDSAFIDFVR